jgi:hypothetical protein
MAVKHGWRSFSRELDLLMGHFIALLFFWDTG